MKPLREVELHAPVVRFLKSLGYEVRSEVKDCDVVGLRQNDTGEDEIVVVELKRGLTIDLLVQGVKRQRNAELVYLAIPRPDRFWFTRKWRDIMHVLRRLELGLILVHFPENAASSVEVVLDPLPLDRTRSQAQNVRRRTGLLKEFKARSADLNIGGSTGVSLMTGYRERSLAIALALAEHGPQAPVKLRTDIHDAKTANILQRNVYGWFAKVERGIYDVTESGRLAGASFAAEYPEIAEHHRTKSNTPAEEPQKPKRVLKQANKK